MKHPYLLVAVFFFATIHIQSQEILWEKTIGGNKSEYLHDMIATPDYGFLLAGSSLSDKSGNKEKDKQGDLDYFLWKMDEDGNPEWQQSFGGSGTDHLYSVNYTSGGGYILGGSSNSPKSGDKLDENYGLDDFWVIKLDPAGKEEWQFTIGGKGQDILLSIQQTKDKGYILGGTSDSSAEGENSSPLGRLGGAKSENSRGGMDFWIIKLDEEGNLEWQRTIGGKYHELLRKIEQTEDEGYILGGYSNSPISGEKTENNRGIGDYWVVKLDKEGNTQWQRTLGGDKDDQLFDLVVTEDKGYLLAGNSNSEISAEKMVNNNNGTDFWVVKLDEYGDTQWQKTYDFGKVDILQSVAKTREGNYLLGGFAQSETHGRRADSKGIDDYIAIKISSEGKELWKKTLGGKESDKLQTVVKSRDGGYILAGTSNSSASNDKETKSNGREDFWVVKLLDDESDDPTLEPQVVEVYPNPAEDYINVLIHKDFKEGNIQMIDLTGSVVLQDKAQTDRKITPLNIQQLQTGAYILKLILDGTTYNSKVIKKGN